MEIARSDPPQDTLGPGVNQADREHHQKHDHLDQGEGAQSLVADCPRKKENRLDVEDYEHQSVDVILNTKANPGFTDGLHAALIGITFGQRSFARGDNAFDNDRRQAENDRNDEKQSDENVIIEDHFGLE